MTASYRLIYFCLLLGAIVIAWSLTQRRQRKLALTSWQRWTVGLAAFVGTMLGAKTPFLGEKGWDGIYDGTVWFLDGKTILGGIVGGYLAVEIAKWITGIRIRTGDSFALPLAVAVAVGRIGCFVGGCCFGAVTDLPWGMPFEFAHDPPGVFRHPTQLYEAAFHAVCAIGLLIMDRKRLLPGNQLKAYLIAYLGYRFCSEWLRPEPIFLLNLTAYQWMSVVLVAVLCGLWLRDQRADKEWSRSITAGDQGA